MAALRNRQYLDEAIRLQKRYKKLGDEYFNRSEEAWADYHRQVRYTKRWKEGFGMLKYLKKKARRFDAIYSWYRKEEVNMRTAIVRRQKMYWDPE